MNISSAIFLSIILLLCGASPTIASAQAWCPIFITQAQDMLEHQTDHQLMGSIAVPASIPEQDRKVYTHLMKRGRMLLRKYHTSLSLQEMVDVLQHECCQKTARNQNCEGSQEDRERQADEKELQQ